MKLTNDKIDKRVVMNVITKILTISGQRTNKRLAKSCYRTGVVFYNLVTFRGRLGLTQWKETVNYIGRLLLRSKSVNPRPPYSVPRCLWSLLNQGRRQEKFIVAILSVFNLHRMVKLEPELDTSSLTSRFSGSLLKLLQWWSVFKRVGQIKSKLIEPWEPYEFEWALLGGKGPHGSPAYEKWVLDLEAIRTSNLAIPLRMWMRSAPFIRGDLVEEGFRGKLEEARIKFRDLCISKKVSPTTFKLNHSRIAFLSDKGGKTRIVAIGDILSQSFLKPLHKRVSKILRRMPDNDGTFDQQRAMNKVKTWSAENRMMYSIDMKSCTDRLPALFQALVIGLLGVVSFRLAWSWYFLTAWRTFRVPLTKPGKKTRKEIRKGGKSRFVAQYGSLRYKVGQPMGLYSSWPIMALTNHFMVWASAVRVYGKVPRDLRYVVLGDDIVIADEPVARTYLQLLSELGVEVALGKSFIEKGLAEFAKGIYRQGKDLRPLSPNLLNFHPKDTMATAAALTVSLFRKGFIIPNSSFLKVFQEKKWIGVMNVLKSPAVFHQSTASVFAQPDILGYPQDFRWMEHVVAVEDLLSHMRELSQGSYMEHIRSLSLELIQARDNPPKGMALSPDEQWRLECINRYTQPSVQAFRSRISNWKQFKIWKPPVALYGFDWIAYDPEIFPTHFNWDDKGTWPSGIRIFESSMDRKERAEKPNLTYRMVLNRIWKVVKPSEIPADFAVRRFFLPWRPTIRTDNAVKDYVEYANYRQEVHSYEVRYFWIKRIQDPHLSISEKWQAFRTLASLSRSKRQEPSPG